MVFFVIIWGKFVWEESYIEEIIVERLFFLKDRKKNKIKFKLWWY